MINEGSDSEIGLEYEFWFWHIADPDLRGRGINVGENARNTTIWMYCKHFFLSLLLWKTEKLIIKYKAIQSNHARKPILEF